MLGSWTRGNLDLTNLSGLSSKNTHEKLKCLLDGLSAILASMQIHSPKAKEDIREIQT